MKISKTYAKLLLKLIQGEYIAIGKFNSKINTKLLETFIADFALPEPKSKGKTKYIYCPNEKTLREYLFSKGITNLEKFIGYKEDENPTRAEGALYASNTKDRNFRVFDGFFLNTYINITGKLNDKKISLNSTQGLWNYIVDYKNFTIDNDITIIGIENTETFKLIHKYKHLFTQYKPLFLLRYNNNSYIDWLQSIPNNYLHFGDFDLPALIIYISDFKKKIGYERCDFFVPNNLEEYFKRFNNYEDYDKQLNDKRIKNFDFKQHKEIIEVVNLIDKYKKVVSQEILMERKRT